MSALIDIRKAPPRFTTDSIERGIFKPETDTHATVAQVKSLLADAEFYTDANGPDMCPPGIKASARATVKWCRGALYCCDSRMEGPFPTTGWEGYRNLKP